MSLKDFHYYTQQEIDDFFHVYKDVSIQITHMKKGLGSPPADGLEDGFPTLDFDDTVDEEVFVLVHSPHEYMVGTDINLHMDFFVDVVDAVVERNVVWGMEYKIIQHGDVFDFTAGAVIIYDEHPIPITTANKELLVCNNLVIPSAALIGEGLLIFRLFRDAVSAGGTDDHVGDARLLYAHLHYTADKYGVPA